MGFWGKFGEYPCFLCSAVEPNFEVVTFSALNCPSCDQAVQRTQRFCRLTGVVYVNTYYDNAGETQQKLNELNLQKSSQFLVVVIYKGAIIGTSTETEQVESFLSEVLKEASQL